MSEQYAHDREATIDGVVVSLSQGHQPDGISSLAEHGYAYSCEGNDGLGLWETEIQTKVDDGRYSIVLAKPWHQNRMVHNDAGSYAMAAPDDVAAMRVTVESPGEWPVSARIQLAATMAKLLFTRAETVNNHARRQTAT